MLCQALVGCTLQQSPFPRLTGEQATCRSGGGPDAPRKYQYGWW